jgi:hypothetical protein
MVLCSVLVKLQKRQKPAFYGVFMIEKYFYRNEKNVLFLRFFIVGLPA